jgi:hypothetical protein
MIFRGAAYAEALPVIILFAFLPIVLMVYFRSNQEERTRVMMFGIVDRGKPPRTVIMALMASVFARGLAGYILPVQRGDGLIGVLLLPMVILIGKMLSGIVADKIGARVSAVGFQLLSSVFALLSLGQGAFGIICAYMSVFFVNLVMGVTLASFADLYPENTGLMFGISPLCLYIGYLLSSVVSFGKTESCLLTFLCLVLSAFMCSKALVGRQVPNTLNV